MLYLFRLSTQGALARIRERTHIMDLVINQTFAYGGSSAVSWRRARYLWAASILILALAIIPLLAIRLAKTQCQRL